MARKKLTRTKKIILCLILFLFIVFIFLFGARIFLYFKFILGHDVLINLNANKENFIVLNGEEAKVSFTTKVTANPFCKVQCTSQFLDISTNRGIDKDSSILTLAVPLSKDYVLKPDKTGEGQELYRFEVECLSIPTFLCDTSQDLKRREVLITLDYRLNNEQQLAKEQSKNNFDVAVGKINQIENDINSLQQMLGEISKTMLVDNYYVRLNKSKSENDLIKSDLTGLKTYWDSYNFDEFEYNLGIVGSLYVPHSNQFESLKGEVINKSVIYNNAIDRLNNLSSDIGNLSSNVSLLKNDSLNSELNSLIIDFNKLNDDFGLKSELNSKMIQLNAFELEFVNGKESLVEKMKITSVGDGSLVIIKSNPVLYGKINFVRTRDNLVNISLGNQPLQCCVFGVCEECCTDNLCRSKADKYPILLLHGHDFSKEVSAEYSLDAFNEIQAKFEKEGYLDAGIISLYSKDNVSRGEIVWADVPITLKLSYYFDVFKQTGTVISVQTKNENIDTYAVRLNDLIKTVKYETNRPKVVIIAHSMGGLVTRRYMQIFGTNDIEQVILIGTPNKGIVGDVATYCDYFGETLECKDMKEDSLFMNKLNNGDLPDVPISVIYGSGCDMNGEDGDGIVTANSAKLEGANNYQINGTCALVGKLHSKLISVDETPEVYNLVLKILRNESTI
ncbi:MAG: alpha/beta hydrolase [Candidatus Pacearchaeota archaeon]|jgi:archaellum component FlaC